MTDSERYAPGPASGVQARKGGTKWTFIRDERHLSERVWQALTNRAHLREWTPYEADGSLSAFGAVKLVTMGAPATHAIPDRLADHLDGHAPADMLKRFADVGVSVAEEKAMKTSDPAARKAAARPGPRADKADGEAAVLAKIAAMLAPYRAMGERLHALILRSAPALQPTLWYGMPAYAREGKVICFFRADKIYDVRA